KALLVADRHDERVHTVIDAGHDDTREDDGDATVLGGVADEVLARVRVRRVDDELLRGRLVRRGRPNALEVGAVPDLGHGRRPRKIQAGYARQVAVVVLASAQVLQRAAHEDEVK